MKKIIFLSLISFLSISLFGQMTATVNSVQYKMLRIFVDDFVDNRFEWVYDQTGLNKIAEGFLFYSNPFEFPYFDGKAISMDLNKDFQFESRIKFISGDVSQYNGIFWGDLIFGSKFFFGFSPMGKFIIMKITGFDKEIYVDQTSEYIYRGSFNELMVRKIGNTYYFYINGNLVYQMEYQAPTGKYFGFSIAPKSYVQISYMKIWYLQQL